MSEFNVLEPAIDPSNRISFLLDWELTMKCNLDCSYCDSGTYGGHDNSTAHPKLEHCLSALKFMFKYADLYMETKPRGIKYVILNIYGGESLHHPDIIEILNQVRKEYKKYQDKWHLTITTTTNAIVSKKVLTSILPFIDEFTVSYHTEHTEKQRKQFKDNLLIIKQNNKRVKCIILMHPEPELFNDANNMISWLTENSIRHLPRQLDHSTKLVEFNYNQEQVVWFDNLYKERSYSKNEQIINPIIKQNNQTDLSDTGRSCCGGRQLCKDTNYKSKDFFVSNKFPDWYCSVNHFFLYVKQVNGEIYLNKDCKMNFNGSVGPIGNLSDTESILSNLEKQLNNNSMPIIQCKKYRCWCGLCAPKSKDLESYRQIMKKYQKEKQ